jgi:hypothetical protein
MIYTGQIDCASRDTFFRESGADKPQISKTRCVGNCVIRKRVGRPIADARSARVQSPARRHRFGSGGKPLTAHPAHQGKPEGAGGSNHELAVWAPPTLAGSRAQPCRAQSQAFRAGGIRAGAAPCAFAHPTELVRRRTLRDGRIRAARNHAPTVSRARKKPRREPRTQKAPA